jgi:Protein of unknown function (DUF1360).
VVNVASVAIDALATYRLTRLLQQDTLPPLLAIRDRLMARYGASPWSELLNCPWCLSVWLGAVVAVLRRVCPRLWGLAAHALAASAVTGLLSQVSAELDREPIAEMRVVDEPKG